MALLRSGGTTRLLQDTVHVKPSQPAQRQQQQEAAAAVPQARPSAGGGTTKLLADMTMVSMVGAKLRGQHTGVDVLHRFGRAGLKWVHKLLGQSPL